MSSAELYLIAAIIAGFAFLFGRDQVRRRRQLDRAKRRGLLPAPRALGGLPASLQRSVLFAVGDGGHEQSVVAGEVRLDGDSEDGADSGHGLVPMTVFDFAMQRDVRGEWGFLDTEPRFRIVSPLTVVAFQLPVAPAPHLVIKRRGLAEKIAEDGWQRYKSVADVVRDASAIERAVAVAPPDGLPRRSIDPGRVMVDHLVWAQDEELARALLDRGLAEVLTTPRANSVELVVEVLDTLVLVYCAQHGLFAGQEADGFVDTAQAVARSVLAGLDERA